MLRFKILGICFLFSLLVTSAAVADPPPVTDFWPPDNRYRVTLLGHSSDGTDTTFRYEICLTNHDSGFGFSHVVFGIPNCLGEIEVVGQDPSTGYEWTDSDPTTGVRGIKFEQTGGGIPALENDGDCAEAEFTLHGSLGLAEQDISIKVGTPGHDVRVYSGPECPAAATAGNAR